MINFIKCKPTDRQILCDLSRKTYEDTFRNLCSEKIMEDYLTEAFNDDKILEELNNKLSTFYLAYKDDCLIGYIKVNRACSQTDVNDEDSLELERIYLLAEFQGLGCGKVLLEEAVKLAVQEGKKYIWLGVWEKNIKAINFYSKNGFYKFGEHVFKMGNEQQNDHLMKKDL